MVKITGGMLKGRRIVVPKNVRATPARVRKALFQMVDVKGKDVCDLFSGSGALGIESISRDAKSVVFVDKSARNMAQLKKTMKNMELQAKFIVADAFSFTKNYSGAFDIVFMDPPYNKGISSRIISYIPNIIRDGGIFVMELSRFEDINENHIKKIKTKQYGDTKIIILEKGGI